MTPQEIRREEIAARRRENTLRAMKGAPPVKGPPRIVIDVTAVALAEFHQLAHRSRTSESALAQRAIRQLLGQVRAGSVQVDRLPPEEIAARRLVDKAIREADPGMTPEAIAAEITSCGRRQLALAKEPGREEHEAGKGPPRVTTGLTRSEFEAMQELALTTGLTVTQWGARAIGKLLDQVRMGALPMVVPSTADNAIGVYD